jgi:hypothetical protein
MTQVYTYEIVGQLFGTNLIQSGSIEDANQQPGVRLSTLIQKWLIPVLRSGPIHWKQERIDPGGGVNKGVGC